MEMSGVRDFSFAVGKAANVPPFRQALQCGVPKAKIPK